jgi:hypothetical protein
MDALLRDRADNATGPITCPGLAFAVGAVTADSCIPSIPLVS